MRSTRWMSSSASVLSLLGSVALQGCAAGAVDAAFTLACLEQGRIPPSLGFCTPDPALAGTPVRAVTATPGRAALSQSLAFGGNNAVLGLGAGEAR